MTGSASTAPSSRLRTPHSSPGPLVSCCTGSGVIEANRENAEKALRAGALVLVFPGGDYDSYRPTFENKIDFAGRTGYIRTAIETGVPIVPMVSIGAQSPNCFSRGGTGWRNESV